MAEESTVVGGCSEQAIGGVEPGSSVAWDERKPGGVAYAW